MAARCDPRRGFLTSQNEDVFNDAKVGSVKPNLELDNLDYGDANELDDPTLKRHARSELTAFGLQRLQGDDH